MSIEMSSTKAKGIWGEKLAIAHFEDLGYDIYSEDKQGVVDFFAKKNGTLYLVETKSFKARLTSNHRRRIIRMSRFLNATPLLAKVYPDGTVTFRDIVEVKSQ